MSWGCLYIAGEPPKPCTPEKFQAAICGKPTEGRTVYCREHFIQCHSIKQLEPIVAPK